MILSQEDYISYYLKTGRFADGQYSPPNKKLNEAQLKTKYNKYIKRQEKKQINITERFSDFSEKEDGELTYVQKVLRAEKEALDRDPDKQEFWKNLTEREKSAIREKIGIARDKKGEIIYDPCHIIGRTQNKTLAIDPENIIYMPRIIHSLIDTYLNFEGKPISKEERENLWKHILGEEWYNRLQRKHLERTY